MKLNRKKIIDPFEEIIDKAKEAKGVELDTDLDVEDLKKWLLI
jgi:pyruvate,orthophosphate dikinase